MDRAGEDQPKRQQGRTCKRTHTAVGHLPEHASSRSSKRRHKNKAQDPSSAAQPQQQPSNQASSSSGFPPELVTCAYAGDSETSFAIPVVDFGAYSLSEKDVPEEQLQSLSKEFKSAFTEVGFVFLKNTGITQEEVDDVMDISKKFFLQPDELKQPFSRNSFSNSPNHGWVSLETERLNPRRPGDLKESFNTSLLDPNIKWPSSGNLKCFRERKTSFFHHCKELSLRVLRVMAHSLGLDPEVFLSTHRLIGSMITTYTTPTIQWHFYEVFKLHIVKHTDKNGTTLRSLYYPPVNCEKAKEGQLRCGEHSDYGTFTLLFQSSEGLQVCARSGEFISVPCIPGAILINIADLMQRWTSDQFISVLHRVLLPPVGDSSTRQSLAFFVHPDDEALITCCDNSNKYPPITAGDYLTERFNDSYGRS